MYRNQIWPKLLSASQESHLMRSVRVFVFHFLSMHIIIQMLNRVFQIWTLCPFIPRLDKYSYSVFTTNSQLTTSPWEPLAESWSAISGQSFHSRMHDCYFYSAQNNQLIKQHLREHVLCIRCRNIPNRFGEHMYIFVHGVHVFIFLRDRRHRCAFYSVPLLESL